MIDRSFHIRAFSTIVEREALAEREAIRRESRRSAKASRSTEMKNAIAR